MLCLLLASTDSMTGRMVQADAHVVGFLVVVVVVVVLRRGQWLALGTPANYCNDAMQR